MNLIEYIFMTNLTKKKKVKFRDIEFDNTKIFNGILIVIVCTMSECMEFITLHTIFKINKIV
jgi:hypothetical protein